MTSSLNLKNYKDATLDSNEIESVLQTMMSQLEDSLLTTGMKAASSIGQIEWLPNERLGLVVKKKPGADQRLGFTSQNNVYFYPEEVLAGLMFQEYFVVNQTTGLPLTLKEAYDVCLRTDEEQMIFAVYKDLKEKGYKVWSRREKSDTAKEEEEFKIPDMSEKTQLITCQESEEQPPAKKIRKDEKQGLLETTNLSLDMIRKSEQVDDDFIKRFSKDWSGYKRMKMGHTSSKLPSLVVNITDHLGEDDLDKRLPSSALIEKSDNNYEIIHPIYSFQRIESFDKVLQSFADKGPQDITSDDYICDDKEETLTVLDFIRNDVKGVAIPTKDHHNLPSAAQLQKFFHENNSEEDINLVILCIVDGFSSIKYFQYNPFKVWKEHPTLWTEVDLTRV